MDLINVLFVIALIYFFSSIQKRKKAGRREEERTEAPQTPEPRSPEAGRTPGQTYDYGEFRKKLRRAWKLPEEKEEGGENTAPCPAEPAQEDTEPAESVKVPLRVKKTQGNEEQEREILRRQAEYLAYAAKRNPCRRRRRFRNRRCLIRHRNRRCLIRQKRRGAGQKRM